eukprot:354352-Chlamydomonas_euryale.AAC.5
MVWKFGLPAGSAVPLGGCSWLVNCQPATSDLASRRGQTRVSREVKQYSLHPRTLSIPSELASGSRLDSIHHTCWWATDELLEAPRITRHCARHASCGWEKCAVVWLVGGESRGNRRRGWESDRRLRQKGVREISRKT